jgi:hypothetical protein
MPGLEGSQGSQGLPGVGDRPGPESGRRQCRAGQLVPCLIHTNKATLDPSNQVILRFTYMCTPFTEGPNHLSIRRVHYALIDVIPEPLVKAPKLDIHPRAPRVAICQPLNFHQISTTSITRVIIMMYTEIRDQCHVIKCMWRWRLPCFTGSGVPRDCNLFPVAATSIV